MTLKVQCARCKAIWPLDNTGQGCDCDGKLLRPITFGDEDEKPIADHWLTIIAVFILLVGGCALGMVYANAG